MQTQEQSSPGPRISRVAIRRLIWPLPLALVAAQLVISCSKSSERKMAAPRDPEIPINVAQVELSPMDQVIPVMGTLAARNEAVVSAQVEGQVEKTLVDFGALVSQGQELALIDTANYEVLDRQADANLTKAEANALNAESNLNRVHELLTNNIAPVSELDLATAQASQARAEVKSAEAARSLAHLNLERSRVKAPFSGSVSERIATAGDYVKIGSPLFRLVDDTELKFIVQAPERYASLINTQQLVRFAVDAFPGREFQGRVYLISPSVSITTRAFNVGALVPNRERLLKANTFARGELVLEKAVPTPTVPLDAIVNFAGVTKVFVLNGGVVRTREVRLGAVKTGRQEVRGGLSAGEWVAITGVTKLYDNARVRTSRELKPLAGS